jgi:Na+/proline symporter
VIIRLPVDGIRVIGRNTQGVKVMNLDAGDAVVDVARVVKESTVDSLLLLASSAIVRDTLQKIVGSDKSERELAAYGKVVTIVIGIIGIAFAIPQAQFIFWFVLFAWSGLGAAFGPALLGILYYRKITRAGVIAGMLGGFLTSVIWVLVFKERTYDLYEAIPGFIAGFALTWGVSFLTWDEPEQVEAK